MTQNTPNEIFDDASKLCLLSFFVFGNYFAAFGFRNSSKALKARLAGDFLEARRQREKARAWALWGLIPSTIINVIIIWWAVIFIMEKLEPLLRQLNIK